MRKFIEFFHFINSEKDFDFLNYVVTTEGVKTFSEEEYTNLPQEDYKLLKYHNMMPDKFNEYINSISYLILNEILDTFHRQQKEEIIELHNKYKFLLSFQKKYITRRHGNDSYIVFEELSISHPDYAEGVKFSDLRPFEQKAISGFLSIEFNEVFSITEQIRRLEYEFPFNRIIKDAGVVSGFEIKNLPEELFNLIYLLLNGEIFDTDSATFKKVFDGSVLSEPAKIKWKLEYRGNSFLRALIYFLSKPIFIDVENDDEFIRKIMFCFCRKDGTAFNERTLKENIRQYNEEIASIESSVRNRGWKNLIDQKVKLIQDSITH